MANQDNYKTYVRETRTTEGSGSGMALIVGGLIVAVAFILWLVFGGASDRPATTVPAGDTTNVTIEPAAPAQPSTDVTIDPAPEAAAPAAPVDPVAPAPTETVPADEAAPAPTQP